MNTENDGTFLRRAKRVALIGALALPLLAACGEDEVAESERAAPPPTGAAPESTAETGAMPATPAEDDDATAEAEPPTGTPPASGSPQIPNVIESTDRAIEAVPPAQPAQ